MNGNIIINSNSQMINLAIQNGCKTIKDFANFLKVHNPKVEGSKPEKEIIQLSLLR